jgi:hypothetical protein
MKHLIEFLICGCIGTYFLICCATLMPRVIAEANAVIRMATERRRKIEQLEEGVQ